MKKTAGLLTFFLTIIFGLTAVKYFLSPSLAIYDASSHLAAANYLKSYLWPSFSGWNPNNLLGFDQGLFYPSLLHWLAATLGFAFGVEAAMKFLLGLSLLLLPVSIYFWLRTVLEDEGKQILALGLITAAVLVLPGYFGADLKALLQVGLLPSFFSLALLFFYLGILNKLNRKNWPFATLLLSSLILTHLIAGLVAGLFLFSFIIQKLLAKKGEAFLFSHLISTFLLTAFFTLPFLINSPFLSQSVHPPSLGWNALIFLVSCLLFFYSWRTKKASLLSLSSVVVLLSFLTSSDFIVERFVRIPFVFNHIYSLHLYRYQIYEILFLLPLVAEVAYRLLKLLNLKLRLFFLLAPLVFALIYVAFRPVFPDLKGLSSDIPPSSEGRFIEAFSRVQVDPYTYTVQNELVSHGYSWAYGLFTDANPNGPYLSSLIRSLNPGNYPPADQRLIENRIINPEKIDKVENLFAINKLLVVQQQGGSALIKARVGRQVKSFSLKETKASPSLVEVVPESLKLKPVTQDWPSRVENWWSEQQLKSLLVKTNQTLKTAANSRVTVLDHNRTWSKLSINIEAGGKVPVLVKFTFLPYWHAYQNGQEIPIYQVSPDLMLINARGIVNFEYKKGPLEETTVLLSLLTLFLLAVIILRNYVQKKNYHDH